MEIEKTINTRKCGKYLEITNNINIYTEIWNNTRKCGNVQ